MDAQFRSRDAVFVDDLPVEALKSRDRALGKLPISHLVEHVDELGIALAEDLREVERLLDRLRPHVRLERELDRLRAPRDGRELEEVSGDDDLRVGRGSVGC